MPHSAMMDTPSPHTLSQPQALLFDMDGVLVDSEALHWETVGDVLRDHLGSAAPVLPPRVGWGDHELWEELRVRFDLEGSAAELTAERGVWALKRIALTPPPPMPYALETLRRWRQNAPNLPMVVVSASPKDQIVQSLIHYRDHLGELLFDAYVSGVDDVARNKPDPAPYRAAISNLGLTPSACWISEDSSTGLTAALGSGAQVIAVGAHSASHSLIERCQLNVNSLDVLYDVWHALTPRV